MSEIKKSVSLEDFEDKLECRFCGRIVIKNTLNYILWKSYKDKNNEDLFDWHDNCFERKSNQALGLSKDPTLKELLSIMRLQTKLLRGEVIK